MTGRPGERDYMSNADPDISREGSFPPSPMNHYRGPHYPPRFGRPYVHSPQSGQPHPFDGTPHYDDEEEGEEDDYTQAGASNDNPLYELEDEGNRPRSTVQGSPPSPGQGSPNINPLYGNDPFQPTTAQTVCMTEFLRAKGPRPKRPFTKVKTVRANYVDQTSIPAGRRPPPHHDTRSRSPPVPLPRQTGGQIREGQRIEAPPARFTPVTPGSPGQVVPGPMGSRGKRTRQQSNAITSAPQSPTGQREFSMDSLRDLIAAVRSDQTLHLGESRRDGNREPRIAGDSDRYFAPRKGDIIVHFNPTPGDNKLLEYFDERRTMQRMQPGDKLVRVKYDKYTILDHLIIKSKLYIYCNGWVYLGKADTTVKTVSDMEVS